MTETTARVRAEARVARLEEALAEYALRFGLTDRARALLCGTIFGMTVEASAEAEGLRKHEG